MKHLWLLVALTTANAAFGQKPPSDGVSAVLDDLRSCAVGLAAGLPSDQKSQVSAGELREDAPALAQALRGKTGIPVEYIASLNELVSMCRSMLMSFAPGSPFGVSSNRATLESLAHDISVKRDDAAANLTGRLVPIEVRTTRAGRPNNGWTVYYQWAPTSPGKDTPLAGTTPLAAGTVVPGLYWFRAEKTVNGQKVGSQPRIVPIGGYAKVQIALAVP